MTHKLSQTIRKLQNFHTAAILLLSVSQKKCIIVTKALNFTSIC